MTDLRGARLSSLARCVRQCAYSALDAPQDEAPIDMTTYFARGHLFNHYVGMQLRAKHGKDAVRSEVEVPWPLGVGHADHVVNGTLAVEVVSTVSPSPHVFGFKARQLKQYMHFGGYEDGAVYVIDPSSLKREDVLPVKLTDDERDEIDIAVAHVALATIDGSDPSILPRVCRKPSDARGYLCPYASTCFADWEAPAASEDDREEARRAALDLYQAKQRERNLKAQIASAETDRKEAQAVLSELLEPGETRVGPFLVKRIPVRGRVTVKNELLKSGLLPDELLAPYVNVSSGYDRFDITRESDASALMADDFGSEAPWTDDDLERAAS